MLPVRKADVLTLQVTEQLQHEFIDTLASQTGFVKRKPRKITPMNFLSAFFITVLSGSRSLSSFAETLGLLSNTCISKQAVHKKMTPTLVEFLERVLEKVLATNIRMETTVQSHLANNFNRVLLQDSTTIKLNPKLACYFPGGKNQSGQISSAMKIQAVYDLLRESFYSFDISGFTKNDQSASPDILSIVSKGDLIIRDLGYFVLSVLKKLSIMGVFFCSRLQHNVSIFKADGVTPFNLYDNLKKHAILDINVVVGAKDRVPVRLVAVPVPENIAAERRRKAKNPRDCRCNHSKEYLALLGWDIFILNIDRELLNTKQIAKLYRLRWRIEIIFKTWKSHFHITDVPNASLMRVKSYILGMLIVITSFHKNYYSLLMKSRLVENSNQLSLLKLSKFYNDQLWALVLFRHEPERIENQMLYHCRYESRKKRLNHAQMVMALG